MAVAAVVWGLAMGAGDALAKRSPYEIKFGVMSMGQDRKFHVIVETTEIHRLVDPTYVHGFEIFRKDGGRFIASYSIRFPEPIEITPELEKAFLVKEGGRVLEKTGEIYWGFCGMPFFFSEGDPLGKYELTVFIDGEKARVFEYHVAPFGYQDDPVEF